MRDMGSRSGTERHEDTLAVGGPGHDERRRAGTLLTRADTKAPRLTSEAPTMRGRELADLDSVHRPRHVARAVRFGGASGAGCRRALLASDRGRSLEGAVPQAVVRADVERCAGTGEPGARERHPQAPTVRYANHTRRSAARPCPSDTRRTSRLHAGRRPAGGGTQSAEPRGPSAGDRSAADPTRCAHTKKQKR